MKKCGHQRLSMGCSSSTPSSSNRSTEVIEIVAGVLLFAMVIVFVPIFYMKHYGYELYVICCCAMIVEFAVRLWLALLCSL
jgi:hypothetical protein